MAAKHKPIAEQLRKAISGAEDSGISRYRIAAATGMSRSQISRIADGVTIPKLDTAEAIANAIGYLINLQLKP